MQLFAPLGVQRVVVRTLLGCPIHSLLALVSTLGACSRGPSLEALAAPCPAAPAPSTPAPPAARGEDAVYMENSGALHVFVNVNGHPTVGHYVRGLPASLRLDNDASAPTALTVLAPLRFDAVTLFPAYYLRRQVVHARPEVTLAAGMALHRVARIGGGQCQGYLGFGDVAGERDRGDGSKILGRYAPDLEIGPVWVPCEALGGASENTPMLDEQSSDDVYFEHPLRLTPVRNEPDDGWYHYEETEFEIQAEPEKRSSGTILLRATAAGAKILAGSSAGLLDEKPGWKKIRLALGAGCRVEGWVNAALFESSEGYQSSGSRGGGFLSGGHREGPPPTYCAGTLEPGAPIVTRSGVPWATVAERIEGVLARGTPRHRLVNFMGRYRDAFCAPGFHFRDSQGHAACMRDAEVRAEDVTLRCPAGKPR